MIHLFILKYFKFIFSSFFQYFNTKCDHRSSPSDDRKSESENFYETIKYVFTQYSVYSFWHHQCLRMKMKIRLFEAERCCYFARNISLYFFPLTFPRT